VTKRKLTRICIILTLAVCLIGGSLLLQANRRTAAPHITFLDTSWLDRIVEVEVTQPFYLYECDRFLTRSTNANLRGLEVVVVGTRGRILIERTKYGESEFIEFFVYAQPQREAETITVNSPLILYESDFVVHHGSRIRVEDGTAFFFHLDDSGRTSGNNLTVIRTEYGIEQHIHFRVYPSPKAISHSV